MPFTVRVALKPVLILIRRRAARRAESALTTVVHRGGDGCSNGGGSRRRSENEKYRSEEHTSSLRDALPIYPDPAAGGAPGRVRADDRRPSWRRRLQQRARQQAQIGEREIQIGRAHVFPTRRSADLS